MTDDPKPCQKCGSPLKPEMKFCESCGTRVAALPVCPGCGAALNPGAKFCESCGKALAETGAPEQTPPAGEPAAAPAEPVQEAPAAAPADTGTEPAVTARATDAPEPAPAKKATTPNGSPEIDLPIDAATVAAAVDVWTGPDTGGAESSQGKKAAGQKKSGSLPLLIGGVLLLALIGAVVWFAVLPLLSGGSTPAGGQPAIPGLPAPTPGQVPVPTAVSPASAVSFVTEPTQVPPANLLVTFQAERDPITGIVTVTFTGGAGRYGVKSVDIRLTRSDGKIDARAMTIAELEKGLTMQGTKTGDDRIEVTANYFNGDQYRIIDRILEYKKRNW